MDESSFSVLVEGGRPWGFTLQGGLEFRAPLRVGKVTPGGKAERAGLIPGDYITSINNTEVQGLKHLHAKQLVINSSSTLQLLCTKTPPVGLFSPPGNKPVTHFSFTSPRSPSSHPSRPRASSFSSPSAQPRPRTSSFTSPSSTTHTSPSPSSTSGKTLSLRRPPPPAVVATTPTRGKSDTLPSGRPRPPVNYQGDIGNSSSGVSSSVSSAASSPPPHPEGGSLQVYPTRHPPPPAKTEPTRVQLANHVTTIPADTADATVISVNTVDMIPNTAETALIPDDTTDTAMIQADAANTTTISGDTRVESDDIIPIISSTGSEAIADLKFDSDETAAVSTKPPVYSSTTVDPVDTAKTITDPVETANVTLDDVDTPADQVDITVDTTHSTKSFTEQASANSTTDQIDTTDTATANPADSSKSNTDQIDTTDTAFANPADQVDTSNVSTDTPDTSNTATDTAELSVVIEAVEKKEPTMAASGGEGETTVEEEKDNRKEEMDEQKEEEKERGLTAAGDESPSAVDPPSGRHEPQTSIDKQLEEARKAREAEMKARATSLLTGKLGSLVRSKPARPASAPISKPPLPPSASVTKPTRHPVTAGPKSPQRVPLSPTAPLGVNRRDPLERKREGVPVVKPYLVKKGEEKPTPQATVPDRTMKDIKMAYRLPGWYKDMFQGFQQTVEELFPDSQSDAQHSRTISTPADMDTYVYDNRGLKVRKSSFSSSSSPVSPVHTRSLSNNNTATTTAPVYVYDHRGLRVRKDSLTETHDPETTPTTVTDLQKEVTTADVLAASRRQYSMDSGYDDKGLRLREGSQGNGDTDHEDTSHTTIAREEVTKGDVIDAVKKPTAYKSDKFSTEPSRTYWSAIDQQFADDQRKKREAELHQEDERDNHRANSEEPSPNHRAKIEGTSPQQKMAHMHPLLTEGLEDVSTTAPSARGEVFDRMDPQKLAGALEHAKTLTTMEQEGVPSHMLPLHPEQREESKEPEKLPPPGKKARALFPFEGRREKELSFQKGAVIDLLHTVNRDWLEGMVGQTKGIFPSSYVQVLSHEELREALAKEKAPLMQARASYDFLPQTDRELPFRKGDIIAITKKIDDNWFQGYLGDQKGIFPSSYVEILEATH